MALYGATSGRAFISGVVGERFAVRNSGATAVVEGVGDHGCEYMTGGRVVVIGKTGRNFAAGMSGGYAYVLDRDGRFESRCNKDLVTIEGLGSEDAAFVAALLDEHRRVTGSAKAAELLARWEETLPRLLKVVPGGVPARAGPDRRTAPRRAERERAARTTHCRFRGAIATRPRRSDMGKLTGFMQYARQSAAKRPVDERLRDYRELELPVVNERLTEQGARCMDCGIPFCNSGCPLDNLIPEWNDHVYRGPLERRRRGAARHQQLPGDHRTCLPGAL